MQFFKTFILLNRLNEEIINFSDKKFLQEQIDLLPISDISTFHAFYEKLLKEYYFKLNISPSFSVLDEVENGIFENLAFQNAVKIFKEEDKYLELFIALNQKRKEKPIFENVKRLDGFLSSIDNKEKWLDENAANLVTNKGLAENIIFELIYASGLVIEYLTPA